MFRIRIEFVEILNNKLVAHEWRKLPENKDNPFVVNLNHRITTVERLWMHLFIQNRIMEQTKRLLSLKKVVSRTVFSVKKT